LRSASIRRSAIPASLAFAVLCLSAPSGATAQHSAILLDALAEDVGTRSEFAAVLPVHLGFARSQLQFARVRQARVETRFNIKRLFHARGIPYPAEEIFLRAFKRERTLEVWVRPQGAPRFALLREYPICALSGELGPKRAQGDRQVPEGFYEIDFFNPTSEYWLSLHVNYPNRSDRALGSGALGGDIFIHGGCSSIGCIAITDDGIKELYWLSVEARAAGQERIPVHIFPVRMVDDDVARLRTAHADRPDLLRFWDSLRPGFDYFEATRQLPPIRVAASGLYRLAGDGDLADQPAASGPAPAAAPRRPAARGLPVLRGTPVQFGPDSTTAVPRPDSAAAGPRLRGSSIPD
jgi:hypothetical protein